MGRTSLYVSFSFRVVHVSMHKMVHKKESAMCVWNRNSPILACMQLYNQEKENVW